MGKPDKVEPRGTGYHYLYLRRPPGVGCQPDGWISREGWLPTERKDGEVSFGVVVYAEPLDPEDIQRFELRPDPARPILSGEIDKKIRQMYRRVHAACVRAHVRDKEYIGFQWKRTGGLRLIVTNSNCGGRSSNCLDLSTHDWAVNALYRLQEESFIPWDWPLDEWVDANFAT